jgi:threonine dehydratase
VEILRVNDDATRAAQALVAERLKLVVEPSSAIVLAAVLGYPERFAGMRLGLILSGGNVA